ncbi:MAG: NCS2 family permease [Planctomycetota bacterium]|jgi:AGZA family xanthine/uracil permease-like MFS transporter
MLERFFRLSEHNTTVRTELLAGLTTFLTMAYIIFVQPAVLTHTPDGGPTGMDQQAVMTATCLAAALATTIMALYGKYPIAQAPGMGENFLFVALVGLLIQQGSAAPWQTALGVVFMAGVLFLLLSLLGVREMLLDTISSSMRNGIAVGIGLFIAFIGLQWGGLVTPSEYTCVKLNAHFSSPDLIVFFFGLLLTAALFALRVRGSIVLGIIAAAALAVALKWSLPLPPVEGAALSSTLVQSAEMQKFQIAKSVVSLPKAPHWLEMDLVAALSWKMVPFILIFLFMDLFDTLGTLVGVSEQAGLIKDNKLPRARQALLSDAVGTTAGAALGTSTVTSFIESAAGVEQGGRTGLTALCTAALFLVALFFTPLVAMIGGYPPITAPALVIVGSMMMRNVTKIDWKDYTEAMPAFLIVIGIPLTFSIADGLALGFIAYPIIKLCTGRGRTVHWLTYIMAVVLLAYFLMVRVQVG